jgi:hypothetical protein
MLVASVVSLIMDIQTFPRPRQLLPLIKKNIWKNWGSYDFVARKVTPNS